MCLISVILLPQVHLRSLNNSTVILNKQKHNFVPQQQRPFLNGKGDAAQPMPFPCVPKSHSKQHSHALDSHRSDLLTSGKQALFLPAIKISLSSPHKDQKERPILLNSETRLGFADRRRQNEKIISLKGSRSQGCSPERQTRLEVRCVSSPHILEEGKLLLPALKLKMNFQEHNGHEGRNYLSSHLSPNAIAPSRSVPSLTNILATHDHLDLSASSPACLLRSAKIRADHCHTSLESVLEHPTRNHHVPMERKIIGQNMEQLHVPSLHYPPQHSHLNVPILAPLSSRSASLNALSLSSNSELVQSSQAWQANSPAGVTSQVALGSFSYSSNGASKLPPPASHAKRALGLHVNNYISMSSSTPDLRDAGQHRFKPHPLGEFSKYIR